MPAPPDAVSVTLALGSSAPYQKTLASRLLSAGMLRRVLVPGLFLEVQDPTPDGSLQVIKKFPASKLFNRVLWGTWARLPAKIRPKPPMQVTGWLSDRLLSKWIEPSSIFPRVYRALPGQLARRQAAGSGHAGGYWDAPSAAVAAVGDRGVPPLWGAGPGGRGDASGSDAAPHGPRIRSLRPYPCALACGTPELRRDGAGREDNGSADGRRHGAIFSSSIFVVKRNISIPRLLCGAGANGQRRDVSSASVEAPRTAERRARTGWRGQV